MPELAERRRLGSLPFIHKDLLVFSISKEITEQGPLLVEEIRNTKLEADKGLGRGNRVHLSFQGPSPNPRGSQDQLKPIPRSVKRWESPCNPSTNHC